MGQLSIDKWHKVYRFKLECVERGTALASERWWLRVAAIQAENAQYFGLAQDCIGFHDMSRDDLRALRSCIDNAIEDRDPERAKIEGRLEANAY